MVTLNASLVVPILIGALIAFRGLRKGSLSKDGAATAFVVGSTMLGAEVKAFGVTLLVLYFIGSRATRVGQDLKKKYEDGVRVGAGQRDAFQVESIVIAK
jgi:uncharacterized membrane protein